MPVKWGAFGAIPIPVRGVTLVPGTTQTIGGAEVKSEQSVATEAAVAATPLGAANIPFGVVDLAASQTNLKLSRPVAASGQQIPFVTPYKGSIVALTLSATAAHTAGTATFKVFVNGVAITAELIWPTGTTTAFKSFVQGKHPLRAGDTLDIRVTTDSAYTPITIDVAVDVYIINLEL